MRVKKPINELNFVKLLFEPNNGSEKLSFSLICRFIREKFKVTQPEMAKKLNIPLITYQSWEQGKSDPNAKAAVNLFIMYLQAIQIKETEDELGNIDIANFIDHLMATNLQTANLER